MFRKLCRTTTVVQYLRTSRGNIPKILRTITIKDVFFPELVILVVKGNGALSEADGYYCTYSFGGRLDLGWRALQCVGHYAESMRLMNAAWRGAGVSLCARLHRAIARSGTRCIVRTYMCVNSVKIPACAFIEVYTEGSQDRTYGK